jgi:hypothetical protein
MSIDINASVKHRGCVQTSLFILKYMVWLKVHVFIEYHTVCPRDPRRLPQAGGHSPLGEGGSGEVSIPTTGEKAWHSVYSVGFGIIY